MRRVLFEVGPLDIQTYGFMLALAFLAAFYFLLQEGRRRGFDEDRLVNFTLLAIILGIFGARAGFVLVAGLEYYWQNPWQFFHLQDGGLSIQGALVGGLIAGLLFAWRSRQSFLRLADAVAPGLALAIGLGRVGCDVFGKPMAGNWFWGVSVNGQLLHPAQVYEFLLDYLLFFYLWRRRGQANYDGQQFIHFAVLYAVIRGVVEFVRYNPLIYGPFSVAHLASLLFIIAAVAFAALLRFRQNRLELATALAAATGSSSVNLKVPSIGGSAGKGKVIKAGGAPGGPATEKKQEPAASQGLVRDLVLLFILAGTSLLLFYGLGPN